MRWRRTAISVLAVLVSLVVALLITSIILLISGNNPLEAYGEMIDYNLRTDSITQIINKATPLYIAGLSVAIGFRMNLFNIGVEGQYRLAGLFAAYVGSRFSIWSPLHILIIIAVAMAVGAAWASIAGLLKVNFNVHEVISTIMLNQIAFGLILWLLNNFMRIPASETGQQIGARTELLPQTAWFPTLDPVIELFGIDLPGGRNAIWGFSAVALLLGIMYWVMLGRTRFGYDLKASGLNPWAAQASGVSPRRMILTTMAMSGAVAGLIGMPHLLNNTHFYDEAFPAGLGFDGIGVALLGQNDPIGIGIGAFLFAFLDRSSGALQLANIEPEVVSIMKGTILMTSVIAFVVIRRWAADMEVRQAAKRLEEQERKAPPSSPDQVKVPA